MATRDELCSQLLDGIVAGSKGAETDLALGKTLRLSVADLLPGVRLTDPELSALLATIRPRLAQANLEATSGWRGPRDSGELAVVVRTAPDDLRLRSN